MRPLERRESSEVTRARQALCLWLGCVAVAVAAWWFG